MALTLREAGSTNEVTPLASEKGRLKLRPAPELAPPPPPKPTLGAQVGGFVNKASEFVAGAAEAPTYTGNSWGETFKNLPNEIVRTILPGAAALNDNPDVAYQVTNKDLAAAVPKALFEGFVAPVASFALTSYGASNQVLSKVGLDTVGSATGEVSFNIPGLGEVTNMQARIAKQYAEQPTPNSALGVSADVAGYAGIELLNGLFAASLLSSVVNPRVITVGKINSEQAAALSTNNGTLGNVPKAAGPKSFNLYEKPTIQTPTFTKLNPEFVKKLSDTGVDMSKYNPANPTFFRFQMNPKGQITGKVLSMKPSFVDEFLGKFKGDITKVPENQLVVLASKEVPASGILKPENAVISTKVATQAVPTPWTTPEGVVLSTPPKVETPVAPPKTETPVATPAKAPEQKGSFELFENEGAWKATFSEYKGRPTANMVYSFLDAKQKKEYDQIRNEVVGNTKADAENKLNELVAFETRNAAAFEAARKAIDDIEAPVATPQAETPTPEITPLEQATRELEAKSKELDKKLAERKQKPVSPERVLTEAELAIPEKQRYYISNSDGNGGKVTAPVKGASIDIDPRIKTFISGNAKNGYIISELSSGLKIADGMTVADVINRAKNAIAESKDLMGAVAKGAATFKAPYPGYVTDKSKISPKKTDFKPAKQGELRVQSAAPDKKVVINGKEYDVQKPLMTKSELKSVVATMPGGKAEFTVGEVNGQLRMQLALPSGKMSLRPSALGLVEDNLVVGQKITISADDLKAPGTALRGIDDEGNVSAMPRNSAGASMSKGSSPIDAFETRIGEPVDKVPEKDFKLYKKVEELVKKYADRVGEGYLPRGAAGVFYHDTRTIRLTGMNDLSVASHEITHRLDFVNEISSGLMKKTGESKSGNPIYDPETRVFRKELTEVYVNHYPGGRTDHSLRLRMVEGYATLLQKYVEAPITTTQNYPNLVAEMLTPGGRFYKPVIGEIIADLQAIVEDYQALNPLDKVGARVTSDLNPTGKKSFLNAEETVTTFIADEVFPFEKLAKETGVGMSVKDPSLYMRRYKGLSSVFARNTTPGSGYWGFNGDAFVKIHGFNWGDLQKGLQKKQLYDQFGHYLVARDQHFNFVELARIKQQVIDMKKTIERMGGPSVARTMKNEDGVSLLDEYKALKDSYISLRDQLSTNGFSEDVVRESYLESKDRFVEESTQYDALVHEDLKLWHKVGRVSDEQFQKLSAKEGYASLKRQFYDQIAGDERVMGSGSAAKRASSLKRRTGSTRTVIHPVLNGIKNHAEITRKAMKQHIENLMVEAASTNALPEIFQKVQVVRVKDANTGAITYPQERDPQILTGFIGGNPKARVAFEMDSSLKNSMNEILDYENAGFIMKLIVASNRLFVKGTTGAFPGFALTNASMDAVTLASQTQQNIIPIYDPLKTLYKALKNREGVVYRRLEEYLANGGELHTLVGWQDLSAKELVEKVSGERSAILAIVDAINSGVDIMTLPEFRGKKITVRTPSLDTLSLPGKWSEIASRFAEYNAAREAGDSIVVASEKAANVTVSFHKMGKFGGGMSRFLAQNTIKAVPFFNPGLQALYTMYRAGLKRGAKSRNRLLFVILAVIGAQLAAFGVLNTRGTQKQKDLYTGLSPEELGGYLWYPKSNGETLGKIRLPNNLNVIGTLVNMNLADRYWGAKYQANEYLAAGTAWLPSQMNPFKPYNMALGLLPQGIKIPVQYITNTKDFPTIRAIESESQLRKEPGQRSTPQTPLVLKWIGEKFNISPIKLEFLITGIFGRASGFLTNKPGVYNPLTVLEKEYYFESSRKVQKYYDIKKTNDQKYNTYKDNPSTFSIKEANDLMLERGKLKQVDTLLDTLGKLDEKKNASQMTILRTQILTTIDTL